MTRRLWMPLACGAVALCCAAAASAARDGSAAQQHFAYSVGYARPAALTGVRLDSRVPAMRLARVRLTPAAARDLARRPGIRFVQHVTARRDAAEPGLQFATGKTTQWEWQFAAANEPAVPDSVLRAASAITIAVIDTGADLTAPDIAAKSPSTYNTRTGTGDVRDAVGHGTFVAALAAGSVTNGEGIAGFGGDASLMVIKAGAGDGSMTDADEAAAIAYAVDHGARVINLSFGGTLTSAAEKTAIDYAVSHGALIVAAAGNHALDGNPPYYPAALLQPLGSNGVGGTGLSVGASAQSGMRAVFSNTGTYLSLAAPGDNVLSDVASTSSITAFPRVALPGSLHGLYGYGSGTSFAAPEVAGAAALVMAANPLLSATDVARVLKASASGHGTWTAELGYGILDVGKAVALAADTQAAIPRASLVLNARVAKQDVRLSARLSTLTSVVSTAGRRVVFERSTAHGKWLRLETVATGTDGRAHLTLRRSTRTLRLRATWSGAQDLAPVSSRLVVVRPPS